MPRGWGTRPSGRLLAEQQVELLHCMAEELHAPCLFSRCCCCGNLAIAQIPYTKHVPCRAAGPTLVSSVLPTPVGPENSRAAMGRLGSLRPPCARRRALDTADTASGWPTTRLCSRHQRAACHAWSTPGDLLPRQAGLQDAHKAAAEARPQTCSPTAKPAKAFRLPAWPRNPHLTF